jgi:hypothetical protein
VDNEVTPAAGVTTVLVTPVTPAMTACCSHPYSEGTERGRGIWERGVLMMHVECVGDGNRGRGGIWCTLILRKGVDMWHGGERCMVGFKEFGWGEDVN